MKIARFSLPGASPRYGVVDEESGSVAVLQSDPIFEGFNPTGEVLKLSAVKLLAPVIPRSKVVCVGFNYLDHRADMDNITAPENPLIFLKPNTSVIGPNDQIKIPEVPGRIVHEGELAVVIGKVAADVPAEQALDYVFGYTIANDVSMRDEMFRDGQWARSKGYDTFCPTGPWIETELDPSNLDITTYVSGELRRQGNTSDMVYSVAEVIAFCSKVWTLLPGDLILMGTPAGLGGFKAGDEVQIDIEGIGTLQNPAVLRYPKS